MNLFVDIWSHLIIYILLGSLRIHLRKKAVETWCSMLVHMTFKAKDTSLHAHQVVGRSFFPFGIVALLLKLLSLEIVARILLIADSQRNEMQLHEPFDDAAFTSHRHHLKD